MAAHLILTLGTLALLGTGHGQGFTNLQVSPSVAYLTPQQMQVYAALKTVVSTNPQIVNALRLISQGRPAPLLRSSESLLSSPAEGGTLFARGANGGDFFFANHPDFFMANNPANHPDFFMANNPANPPKDFFMANNPANPASKDSISGVNVLGPFTALIEGALNIATAVLWLPKDLIRQTFGGGGINVLGIVGSLLDFVVNLVAAVLQLPVDVVKQTLNPGMAYSHYIERFAQANGLAPPGGYGMNGLPPGYQQYAG